MTKESLTAFLIGPAGLPLAISLAIYARHAYKRRKFNLKDGRELPAEAAPFRFCVEVLGALGLAQRKRLAMAQPLRLMYRVTKCRHLAALRAPRRPRG